MFVNSLSVHLAVLMKPNEFTGACGAIMSNMFSTVCGIGGTMEGSSFPLSPMSVGGWGGGTSSEPIKVVTR